ncbi:MAG: hypothetical protein PHV61_05560 [Limnochordia bacterium]|nr:hypothetical protein [Limnochordia bacterium]MDD4518964.1 hypothetical protein [Limnochordia bacterium]
MNYCDAQVRGKIEEAWAYSWERFFHEETDLFYDYISSYELDTRFDHLPSVEDISRGYPEPNGWGTGMEDSALNGGVMMSMVCDRYDITQEDGLHEAAKKVFSGLLLCGSVGTSEGFVARSVSPFDGNTHYIETSIDQYTWYVYGLWRYFHSSLSSSADRERIASIINSICARIERNVREENDYHIGRDDNTFDGRVDRIWECQPWETARLPMIYLVGWDITGESKWFKQYTEYAWKAAIKAGRIPLTMRYVYAFLQHQVSLRILYQLENKDLELKRLWLEDMHKVTDLTERFIWHCLDYRPLDMKEHNMNWRTWSRGMHGNPLPPKGWPNSGSIRLPAEAFMCLLLSPERELKNHEVELLRRTIAQVDYGKEVFYSLFYVQAAYWLARKRSVLDE